MLPSMKYADRIQKTTQIKFGGINRALSAKDGELAVTRNLTSNHAPALASREARLLCRKLDNPGGIFSWNELCWVEGTTFYYDGTARGQVSAGKKQFASMGAYVVIFPDKCWYNVDSGEFGSMESKWSGKSLTFGNGKLYEEDAEANAITCAGVNWADWFNPGDAVTIGGCTNRPANNKTVIIRAVDGDTLNFYENTFSIPDGETAYTENGSMTVERTVPQIRYLCENENRLWGCTENTIYCSKLGDIFNWNVYDGLDTDSWTTDAGSAGKFTGCITFRGYPTFFKEDHIYKVYGSVPSNFEVLGSASLGLAEGSDKSLAVAGETLFYLSRNGIMAYTGGLPQPMGEAFGTGRYWDAAGGSDGLKYYVSMRDAAGGWGLYVFDTQRGTWLQEDESQMIGFARLRGNLYCLDADGQIWLPGDVPEVPEDASREAAVNWMVEFADFTEEDPNKKGISKLQLRLELEAGATAQVWIQYDSDGQWQPVSSALGEGTKQSYYLPVIPRRADHYRIKITGQGGCRIYSMTRETYSGSELRSKTGRN